MIEKAVKKKLASIYKEAKTRNRLEVPELLVGQQLSAGEITTPNNSLSPSSNKSKKKRSRSNRAEAVPRPPQNSFIGNGSKNG